MTSSTNPTAAVPDLVISLHADHEFGMLLDRRNHGQGTRILRCLCDEAQPR